MGEAKRDGWMDGRVCLACFFFLPATPLCTSRHPLPPSLTPFLPPSVPLACVCCHASYLAAFVRSQLYHSAHAMPAQHYVRICFCPFLVASVCGPLACFLVTARRHSDGWRIGRPAGHRSPAVSPLPLSHPPPSVTSFFVCMCVCGTHSIRRTLTDKTRVINETLVGALPLWCRCAVWWADVWVGAGAGFGVHLYLCLCLSVCLVRFGGWVGRACVCAGSFWLSQGMRDPYLSMYGQFCFCLSVCLPACLPY